jgi:hypothetical protein
MADDTRIVHQTIGVLRSTVDELRRLADLDSANAEAIRCIADQCDRQISDLSKNLGIEPLLHSN